MHPLELGGNTKEAKKTSCESLSHTKWNCKYHVVFVAKGRKKVLYGKIREFLGPVFRELARQRESEIIEGHMVQDHVHMLIKIPPKHAVAEVIGYVKGKVQLRWRGNLEDGRRISLVKVFGRGGMRYLRLNLRKKMSGNIYAIKNNWIIAISQKMGNFSKE